MATRRILAIDPGTRRMGIAVFENRKLSHYGVVNLQQKGLPHARIEQCGHVIAKFIQDYAITEVVIEGTFGCANRRIILLKIFIEEIRVVVIRRGLIFVSYAPSSVKKRVCGNGYATKDTVAQAVIRIYPGLERYLAEDGKVLKRHYGHMFDAVAVGLTALHQIRRSASGFREQG